MSFWTMHRSVFDGQLCFQITSAPFPLFGWSQYSLASKTIFKISISNGVKQPHEVDRLVPSLHPFPARRLQTSLMELCISYTLARWKKSARILNASFSTLTRFKALYIHSIRHILTLSVLYVTLSKGFVLEGQRTALIPLGYSEQHNWYQVFELMVRLQAKAIRGQESVDGELREQHSNAIIRDEDAIRRIFEGDNMHITLNIPNGDSAGELADEP
ncbi:hypothetical protein BJV82DRAFT_663274 [Fennellomyces sp. T-0311]|nr:hypothetical protein BJV82DRAFT_663274 [Fennellomyces sp. T-0311]